MLKRYSEEDGDLEVLKDKIIAVIGYGSQGEAQANCFKDSGLNVIVGLRKGESWEKAEKEGHNVMSVSDAVENASIIHVLIPDEVQGEVYNNSIRSYLTKGKTLSFSHGFSITYGIIKPPEDVNVIMVAPMGPGPEVRSSYQAGSGIASLIAIKQDAEDGLRIALALAKGCGLLKKGCLECSFEQETIQDLFSEQAVLCGGMVELIKMAFNTLVENGYPEELAYFCLHESNLITKLLTKHGIEGMYGKVSNTAEYGGRKVGKFLINDKVRGNMEKVLNNVKNGDFVKDFLDDYDAGFEKLKLLREKSKSESIEKVGKDLRKFINK